MVKTQVILQTEEKLENHLDQVQTHYMVEIQMVQLLY